MRPTLLIVDDHSEFRIWARSLLDAGGFEVIGEVEDGASAMTAAAQLRPDVVLLDVHLPDRNGLEVARQLMTRPGAPAVVLISSRDVSDLGAAVHRCGARGFIPKEELSGERLHTLLGQA